MAREKGTWFVEFPTYQYNEDVVELARKEGLRIIDARFDNGKGVKGPKLTRKGEKQSAASK